MVLMETKKPVEIVMSSPGFPCDRAGNGAGGAPAGRRFGAGVALHIVRVLYRLGDLLGLFSPILTGFPFLIWNQSPESSTISAVSRARQVSISREVR
jgi:hypothetical protein